MATKLFINLSVKDLDKSKDFFGKLGYGFDSRFTNEQAACMIISDDIFVMLLPEPFFKTFIKKEIADTQKTTEVINCISLESKAAVDEMVRKALAAGGGIHNEPQDHGFMYVHGYQDLDGHLWEVMYLEPEPAKSA